MAIQYLGIADIAAVVIVLLISASIGIYFRFSGGRQKTAKEFLMAGRSMSPFPVVFSLVVTFVSAIMMLGIPSEVYQFGLYRMIAYICSTFSNVISAYIFLPVYFQMGDSVSVYEYLERRFGILTRKVSSVLFILQTVFYMAVVLYAPALALSVVSDIKIHVSILSIGGICTLYCCLGGMKAVLWTDVFQAIIMYICIFAIVVKGIMLADSIPEAFHTLHARENKFFSYDLNIRYTIWNCVLYGFLYGLCNYGCNQAQVQRMLSVKSLKLSQRAVIVSVPLALLFIVVNFFIGVVMYANYYKADPLPCEIKQRDMIVPYFIMHSFKDLPGLAGLCVAGIFSGALSTISSSVNALAAVTMEDFVQPYFETRWKITDSMAAFLVKVFACAYGILGICCAFAVQKQGLIYAYTVVYGTISGPVLGLFTLGMLTVTTNEKGAVRGLMSGILVTSSLGIISYFKMKICEYNCPKDHNVTTTMSAVVSRFLNNTTKNYTFNNDFDTSITDVANFTSDVTVSPINATTSTREFASYTGTNFMTTTTEPTEPCQTKDWLSNMWLLVVGFAVTVIVGYIASIFINRSRSRAQEKSIDIDPVLLSPFIRKWIAKPSSKSPQDAAEEFVKLNGCSEA